MLLVSLQPEWASRLTLECRIDTYLPILKPSPFSFKRKEACETNSLPPDPLQDPEGCIVLPKSTINGKLGGRQVQIDIPSLSLYLNYSSCYQTASTLVGLITSYPIRNFVSLVALLRMRVHRTVLPDTLKRWFRRSQLPLNSKISFRSLNASDAHLMALCGMNRSNNIREISACG